MPMKNSRHRELATGQAGKRNLQSRRLQRNIEISRSISRYFLTTREQLDMKVRTTRMCRYPHGFISGREFQRQWEHRVSGIYRRVSSGSSGEISDHQGEGLSGMKEVREPRVRVSKIFNPKEKRAESQSKGTEKKMLIPPSFCDVGR